MPIRRNDLIPRRSNNNSPSTETIEDSAQSMRRYLSDAMAESIREQLLSNTPRVDLPGSRSVTEHDVESFDISPGNIAPVMDVDTLPRPRVWRRDSTLTDTFIREKLNDFRTSFGYVPEHIIANPETMREIFGTYSTAYRIAEATPISQVYGLIPITKPRCKTGRFVLC